MENDKGDHKYGRVYQFSPGPCVLPLEILEQSHSEYFNWHGCGTSAMEMGHRSKEFTQIIDEAEKGLRKLINIPANYKVWFLQGGATLQFAAVPLNLLRDNKKANYLTTGHWSVGAIDEAKKYGEINEVWPTSGKKFTTIPAPADWKVDKDASYFHYCFNETIHGVEFHDFPFEAIPENQVLVCDMSSNFLSRPIDVSKYGIIYAGAQKNVGPAGVTIVIVREDLIGKELPITPTMCSYKTFAAVPYGLFNTPPCYGIYMCGLNIQYMIKNGGVEHYHEQAKKKSGLIYDVIDNSGGYYSSPVDPKYRSRVNIPFRVKSDETLEKKFIAEAAKAGLIELGGHRSVGGCRASLYNAMPVEGAQALADFMKKFQQDNQ